MKQFTYCRFDAESNLQIAKEKMSSMKEAADSVNGQMNDLESEKKDEQKKSKKIVKLVTYWRLIG